MLDRNVQKIDRLKGIEIRTNNRAVKTRAAESKLLDGSARERNLPNEEQRQNIKIGQTQMIIC